MTSALFLRISLTLISAILGAMAPTAGIVSAMAARATRCSPSRLTVFTRPVTWLKA